MLKLPTPFRAPWMGHTCSAVLPTQKYAFVSVISLTNMEVRNNYIKFFYDCVCFFFNLSSKHQSYLFWSDFCHLLNVLFGKKRSLIGAFFSGKPVRVISQGYKRSLTLPHGEPNKVQLWVVRWKRNEQKRRERI